MGIEMIPVVSSNISAYGYDEETQVLDIQFQNSLDTYSYDQVPKDVAMGLKTAVSPGQYFRNQIKGRYKFYKS
jgi:KTSC domain